MKEGEVLLRAMEPEDLDLLYRVENDRDLWALGSTNVPYSRYVLHDFLAQSTGDIYRDRQARLMVEWGGVVVGIADLTNFDPKHLRGEVGIVIESPYRKKGIALAVLKKIENHARCVLHMHQLYAVVAADNAPSLALFAKAGYQNIATLGHWLSGNEGYQDAVLLQLLL